MYGESWYKQAENKIKKIIAEAGIVDESAAKMFNDIEDVMSDVAWEAKQEGSWQATYDHSCNTE